MEEKESEGMFGGIKSTLEEAQTAEKIPLIFKFFGICNIIMGILALPLCVFTIVAVAIIVGAGGYSDEFTTTALILLTVVVVLSFAIFVLYIKVGTRLLKNNRRGVSKLAYIMVALHSAIMVCSVCMSGFDRSFLVSLAVLLYLIVLAVWIDPSLMEERQLQRKLGKMELRDDVEEGTLGRDKTGKGYIKLDFFNLFWIFFIACIVGIAFETVYVSITLGAIQNRTGVVWGWFSPIYGFGALLMTVALNRFWRQNVLITFVVSALIGGAFEFFVSWFLQTAFGIVAWDYSGAFLSIDGRTDLFHLCAWGLLGTVWIRLLLPGMLRLVNLIPWKARYVTTVVVASFMLVNCLVSLVAFDRWFERQSGVLPESTIESVVDENYSDEWMARHFQTMSIHPDIARSVS